mgnify:CR=1 FL=1
MRYNKDGAFEISKEVLQPADCLNVQMVGRLVQQQNIRLAEQRTRQQHLDLLDVTEVLHFGVQDGICIQAQTVQQLAASVSASQPPISANSDSSSAACCRPPR